MCNQRHLARRAVGRDDRLLRRPCEFLTLVELVAYRVAATPPRMTARGRGTSEQSSSRSSLFTVSSTGGRLLQGWQPCPTPGNAIHDRSAGGGPPPTQIRPLEPSVER